MKAAYVAVALLMTLALVVALTRFWGSWATLVLTSLGQTYVVLVGIAPFFLKRTMATLPSYVKVPYLPGDRGNAVARAMLFCFYMSLYVMLLCG